MEALEVIRREREAMERQYAALRAENESLKRLIQSDEGLRRKPQRPSESGGGGDNKRRSVRRGSEEERRRGSGSGEEEEEEEEETLSDSSRSDPGGSEEARVIQRRRSAARSRETSRDLEEEFYLDNESSVESSPTSTDQRYFFEGMMMDDSNPKTLAPVPPPQRRRSLSHVQTSNRPTSATGKFASQLPSPLEIGQSNQMASLPQLLWKGGILWKIPFNGRGLPERRLVMIKRVHRPTAKSKPVRILGPDLLFAETVTPRKDGAGVGYISFPPTVIWANPEKPDDLSNARELILGIGAHLVEGHQSPAFWKTQSRGTCDFPPEWSSLS